LDGLHRFLEIANEARREFQIPHNPKSVGGVAIGRHVLGREVILDRGHRNARLLGDQQMDRARRVHEQMAFAFDEGPNTGFVAIGCRRGFQRAREEISPPTVLIATMARIA